MIYLRNENEIQFVISDTKGVEFQHFRDSKHLLFEPATSVFTSSERLAWLIDECDRRMDLFAKVQTRNIHEYNNNSCSNLPGNSLGFTKGKSLNLPFIILVIDELADLLTDRSKDKATKSSIGKLCSEQISRIVARSRAAGVYVIAATQRPSVDIINGVVKANFPARISFRLPSNADSRTVLSQGGAENLLSQGDMLFLNPNKAGLQRIHAPIAPLTDITACLEYAKGRS
jgi:S-DNA-T family DNA segregation ATPase FtsK/SpoIIIE